MFKNKKALWIILIVTVIIGVFVFFHIPEIKLALDVKLSDKDYGIIAEKINYCKVSADCRVRVSCCTYVYHNKAKNKIVKALQRYEGLCDCFKISGPQHPECLNGKCVGR